MAPDPQAEEEPILQPRLIRFLKNRRKLVGGGIREEFWEEVERNVIERRRPDTAAERAVQNLMDWAAESTAPVARRRMRERLSQANESIFRNL